MHHRLGLELPKALSAAIVALSLTFSTAAAGPWAVVGDAQLRSDIEILASAGVIDNITMQWPLPWRGVLVRLKQPGALDGQPEYVRDAAMRVLARGGEDTKPGRLQASVAVDAASAPSVVRGFDALGRQDILGQGILEYQRGATTIHLALGARTVSGTDRQIFVPDGSYISRRVWGANIYAGYVEHWWGPGWISAMSLSSNARPVPQIGIARADTAPFESPWLSWLGPWQMEFFVGVLDGPRAARNTIYNGFRFGFSPLPHLEIGISRTDMMCGTGHPCKPLVGYFDLMNQDDAVNIVNDQGTIDIRYSGAFDHWAYELYAQAMNEDSNPIVHSGTSHLIGGSVWTPLYGGIGRLTVEYADSLATKDIWGGGVFHGFAYNNWQYTDGMRYRGRTLGFSLDSDSQLISLQASFTDRQARSYTLTYHHADISDPLNTLGNAVTASPVTLNIVQGRVSLPLRLNDRSVQIDIEGRIQDEQPRPNRGFLASIEVAFTVDL
jgi:hypothetical protein